MKSLFTLTLLLVSALAGASILEETKTNHHLYRLSPLLEQAKVILTAQNSTDPPADSSQIIIKTLEGFIFGFLGE
jgi:hypothetical protein